MIHLTQLAVAHYPIDCSQLRYLPFSPGCWTRRFFSSSLSFFVKLSLISHSFVLFILKKKQFLFYLYSEPVYSYWIIFFLANPFSIEDWNLDIMVVYDHPSGYHISSFMHTWKGFKVQVGVQYQEKRRDGAFHSEGLSSDFTQVWIIFSEHLTLLSMWARDGVFGGHISLSTEQLVQPLLCYLGWRGAGHHGL